MYNEEWNEEWEDIKYNITEYELMEIIDNAMDENMTIEGSIQDFIEANYEPIHVLDADRARDEYIDRKLEDERD